MFRRVNPPFLEERAPHPVTQTAAFVAYLLTKTRQEFAVLYEPYLKQQVALLTEIRDLLSQPVEDKK